MLIKVCGLREPANIAQVSRLPVNWLGLIFFPKSPRYVGDRKELPRWLAAQALPQQRVGVFVDAEVDEVVRAAAIYSLNRVQLHGAESPAYCRRLRTILEATELDDVQTDKAFSVSPHFDFAATADYADSCHHFLFDTKGSVPGGTGQKFDWDRLRRYEGETPFLLSGGIGPDDLGAVQAFRHPCFTGIDLNSRFESAPALKSLDLLAPFVYALRNQPKSN